MIIPNEFPATLSIDYKSERNRITTFFRFFLSIPIVVVSFVLTRFTSIIVFPVLLMLVFQRKYPKWWFDFNLANTQFATRVMSYVLCLVDEYPSTDEEQSVHLNLEYPDAKTQLNQFLPIVKWILVVPHYICLALLLIISTLVSLLAWLAILFLGKYPESYFNYQIGVCRWCLRVEAYAFLLTTDKYPPFSLK